VGTNAAQAAQRLGIYIPDVTVRVGAPIRVIAALQNAGHEPLELILPCGHYFELYATDEHGAVVYDWTAAHYPARPGQPAMPPCPRHTRVLAPGEGVQAAFSVPTLAPGRLMLHVTRFGGP
jgi:hypothetical protein